jgi:MFS family permease
MDDGATVDTADLTAGSSSAKRSFSPDAIWTLAVLLMIYILSMLVRNIVPMLVPEMKHSLHLSDSQLGLVLGPAFSVSYAVFSLPLGWAADRYSRRWILLLSTMLFGFATITTGLAGGMASLFTSRLLVALGEAGLGPASTSLLSAKVPRRSLATAISAYMTGTKIGSAAAYSVAGTGLVIAGAALTDWGLKGFASWQMLMIFVGAPAVLVALLMLTVAEPARFSVPGKAIEQGAFAFLREQRRLLVPVMIAFALMGLCANSLVGWVPTYMTRQFHMPKQVYGPILGLYSILAAVTLVVKGMVVDWLYRRGVKDVHLRFYAWLVGCTMPVAIGLFLVKDAQLFLVMLAIVQVIAVPVTSYAATLIQVVTPPALRGRMAAISALFLVMIGGLGPSVVAALTDYFFQSEARVGDSLAVVTITVFPLTLLFLIVALRPLRARVLAVEAEQG